MSSEQKALEIIKVLAAHIQEANKAGVQVVMYGDALYGDDDETTLEEAILSCAGIDKDNNSGRDIKVALGELISYLTACRPREEAYRIYSVGEKMAKITCSGSSVHCFVAVKSFTNRTLGHVKAGQIFKPASWKAPAKHARGDLFDINTWHKCFTDYGVRYL